MDDGADDRADARYLGRERRQRNQILENRIEDLELDMQTLRRDMDGMKHQMGQIDGAVQHNTRLTEGVKSDTEEMVSLLKGSKVIGKFIAWGVPIAAAIMAIVTYWKEMRS